MFSGLDPGKLDNLSGREAVAFLHTLRRVVKAGVEGVQPERPDATKGRIADVNQPVPISELDGLLTDNGRLSHKTKRHNAYSQPATIRQRGRSARLASSDKWLISQVNPEFPIASFSPLMTTPGRSLLGRELIAPTLTSPPGIK